MSELLPACLHVLCIKQLFYVHISVHTLYMYECRCVCMYVIVFVKRIYAGDKLGILLVRGESTLKK